MLPTFRRILLVDDKPEHLGEYLRRLLAPPSPPDWLVPPLIATAHDRRSAERCLLGARDDGAPFEVLVTDLFIPFQGGGPPRAEEGLSLLRRLREPLGQDPAHLDVLLLSQEGEAHDHEGEIAAFGDGWRDGERSAFRYAFRDRLGDAEGFVEALFQGFWDRLDARSTLAERRPSPSAAGRGWQDSFVTSSPALIERLDELLEKIAPTDVAVLLLGESGTGKEVVAQLIHRHSPRRGGLVELNCANLDGDLVNSTLFGTAKGAFTGAVERKGLLKTADRGTLFLDEVGDLPPASQAKLLRALQEKRFHPLGSDDPVESDFRLVCATKQPLDERVREGRFREDLYYRISMMPFALPPLRERRGDVPLLVEHFTRRAGTGHEWTQPALALLVQQEWPGNVRQLKNLVTKHLSLATPGTRITPDQLKASLRDAPAWDPALLLLDSPQQRLYHLEILPLLRAATPGAKRPQIGEALHLQRPDVFHEPGEAVHAFDQHRKRCALCRRLFDDVQGGAARA